MRATVWPLRAQQPLGVRNQGVQSCGEAPCRGLSSPPFSKLAASKLWIAARAQFRQRLRRPR
jgi:hypothetical protein